MDWQVSEVFNDSYERCASDPAFFERFYDLFVASSPEVAEKFAHTDMRHQAMMLKRSLYMLMGTQVGVPGAAAHLKETAELHSSRHLDIRPPLYDLWLDCLIEAARQSDQRFTVETGDAWRKVLAPRIALMKERYK